MVSIAGGLWGGVIHTSFAQLRSDEEMSRQADLATAYLRRVADATHAVPGEPVARAVRMLVEARAAGATVFVCGNGGSAAIASHLAVDLLVTARRDGTLPLRTVCLSDSTPTFTAVANDHAYADVFASQVTWLARPGDLVLGISSSGRSANIVRALARAHDLTLPTIALVGFDGGPVAETADLVIYVPVHDSGVVEDVHSAICHALARGLAASCPEAG